LFLFGVYIYSRFRFKSQTGISTLLCLLWWFVGLKKHFRKLFDLLHTSYLFFQQRQFGYVEIFIKVSNLYQSRNYHMNKQINRLRVSLKYCIEFNNVPTWSKYLAWTFVRAAHILQDLDSSPWLDGGNKSWFTMILWMSILNFVSSWTNLSVSKTERNSAIQTQTNVVWSCEEKHRCASIPIIMIIKNLMWQQQ